MWFAGAPTLSFTEYPYGGESSELEASERGSLALDFEEGVGAILSLGSEIGTSPSTTDGKVDGGKALSWRRVREDIFQLWP